MKWNNPVNMTFIVDNFDTLFDTYMRNVTYKFHKSNHRMKRALEFNMSSYDEKENSINFTATFHQPYLLGLLEKKKDTLYFEFNQSLVNTSAKFHDDDKFQYFFAPGIKRNESRIFPSECLVARSEDDEEPADNANNTCPNSVIKNSRIQLQFDFRGKCLN